MPQISTTTSLLYAAATGSIYAADAMVLRKQVRLLWLREQRAPRVCVVAVYVRELEREGRFFSRSFISFVRVDCMCIQGRARASAQGAQRPSLQCRTSRALALPASPPCIKAATPSMPCIRRANFRMISLVACLLSRMPPLVQRLEVRL